MRPIGRLRSVGLLEVIMSTAFLDTAVIGAGAAGLTVGRHLSELDRTFELYDEHARVGDSWRERYRSLRLFTPRRFASLPGLRLDVGTFGYPTGQQMGDYLERYAQHFALPVRTSSRVVALTRTADGPFRLELGNGDEVFAEHVIVTAGAHRVPVVPGFASELDPSIRQLHSLHYQGPEQFAEGPVLVVGAANSGTDVALEAARAGHAVTLAGRHPGQVPVDIDTPFGNIASGLFIRHLRSITIDSERGRAMKRDDHGVMLVRNRLADLDRAGVVRIGRVSGVTAGRPVADDGVTIDAATVVWCTGSRADLGWLRIDDVFGPDGAPREYRGIATGCPGLAFVGLEFQYSVASATLMGMDRDARHVVRELFTGDAVTAATHATDRAVA
jgi:putative flavoprotein involved in K+ transport